MRNEKLAVLEKLYINVESKQKLKLSNPTHREEINADDPDLVDEGFLICEVKKLCDTEFTIDKVNSRLELFSQSRVSNASGTLAEIALDSTRLWFSSRDVVVATGDIDVIMEKDNHAIYKLFIQIQKWH